MAHMRGRSPTTLTDSPTYSSSEIFSEPSSKPQKASSDDGISAESTDNAFPSEPASLLADLSFLHSDDFLLGDLEQQYAPQDPNCPSQDSNSQPARNDIDTATKHDKSSSYQAKTEPCYQYPHNRPLQQPDSPSTLQSPGEASKMAEPQMNYGDHLETENSSESVTGSQEVPTSTAPIEHDISNSVDHAPRYPQLELPNNTFVSLPEAQETISPSSRSPYYPPVPHPSISHENSDALVNGKNNHAAPDTPHEGVDSAILSLLNSTIQDLVKERGNSEQATRSPKQQDEVKGPDSAKELGRSAKPWDSTQEVAFKTDDTPHFKRVDEDDSISPRTIPPYHPRIVLSDVLQKPHELDDPASLNTAASTQNLTLSLSDQSGNREGGASPSARPYITPYLWVSQHQENTIDSPHEPSPPTDPHSEAKYSDRTSPPPTNSLRNKGGSQSWVGPSSTSDDQAPSDPGNPIDLKPKPAPSDPGSPPQDHEDPNVLSSFGTSDSPKGPKQRFKFARPPKPRCGKSFGDIPDPNSTVYPDDEPPSPAFASHRHTTSDANKELLRPCPDLEIESFQEMGKKREAAKPGNFQQQLKEALRERDESRTEVKELLRRQAESDRLTKEVDEKILALVEKQKKISETNDWQTKRICEEMRDMDRLTAEQQMLLADLERAEFQNSTVQELEKRNQALSEHIDTINYSLTNRNALEKQERDRTFTLHWNHERLKEAYAMVERELEERTKASEAREKEIEEREIQAKAHEMWAKADMRRSIVAEIEDSKKQPTSERPPEEPVYDLDAQGGIPERGMGQFLYHSLHDRHHELLIKLHLLEAGLALENQKISRALTASEQAMKSASILRNKGLIGRCSYYRGRAEYAVGRFFEACSYLAKAEYAQGRYIEGDQAREWLKWAEREAGVAGSELNFFEEDEGFDDYGDDDDTGRPVAEKPTPERRSATARSERGGPAVGKPTPETGSPTANERSERGTNRSNEPVHRDGAVIWGPEEPDKATLSSVDEPAVSDSISDISSTLADSEENYQCSESSSGGRQGTPEHFPSDTKAPYDRKADEEEDVRRPPDLDLSQVPPRDEEAGEPQVVTAKRLPGDFPVDF